MNIIAQDDGIGFALPFFLKECPEFWQNFVQHITRDRSSGSRRDHIKKALREYQARFVDKHTNVSEYEVVLFETQADLLLFVLKWT